MRSRLVTAPPTRASVAQPRVLSRFTQLLFVLSASQFLFQKPTHTRFLLFVCYDGRHNSAAMDANSP